jgi:hypothetical protein
MADPVSRVSVRRGLWRRKFGRSTLLRKWAENSPETRELFKPDLADSKPLRRKPGQIWAESENSFSAPPSRARGSNASDQWQERSSRGSSIGTDEVPLDALDPTVRRVKKVSEDHPGS